MYHTAPTRLSSPMPTAPAPPDTHRATARLVGDAVIEACRPDGDVWPVLRSLSERPDAARIARNAFRRTTDPLIRWALVFIVAQLGDPEGIPMLIEAGLPCPEADEVTRSAARIACTALATYA